MIDNLNGQSCLGLPKQGVLVLQMYFSIWIAKAEQTLWLLRASCTASALTMKQSTLHAALVQIPNVPWESFWYWKTQLVTVESSQWLYKQDWKIHDAGIFRRIVSVKEIRKKKNMGE